MSAALGFTWRGVHSSRFGGVKIKSRPVVAEVKESVFEIANYDGTLDLSDVNEFGRYFYQDKVFSVEIYLTADTPKSLQTKVGRAAAWLAGKGWLIFDDTPLVRWSARVMQGVSVEYAKGAKGCTMQVSFRAAPFCELWKMAGEGVYLGDDDILLGMDNVTIGGTDTVSRELVKMKPAGEIACRFNDPEDEDYSGDYWLTEAPAAFKVEVELGDTTDVIKSVFVTFFPPGSYNGESMQLDFSGIHIDNRTSHVVINCDQENFYVDFGLGSDYKIQSATNQTRIGGDAWIMIKPGWNKLSVNPASEKQTRPAAKVKISYRPRFFHNADTAALLGGGLI